MIKEKEVSSSSNSSGHWWEEQKVIMLASILAQPEHYINAYLHSHFN